MTKKSSIIIGKSVRRIARLKGDGSALPGLVVEKIDSGFVHDCLSKLPKGVVVISGTNGKTTTTKIVVELLESQGLKVFTNRTGSNFVRGVIAALLESISLSGKLDADIAVLELDEAHAIRFIDTIQPRYSLLLNVFDDQLDRFKNADYTAELLAKLASATTSAVIVNREDPRLINLKSPASVSYFGLKPSLRSEFLITNISKKLPKATVTLEQVKGQNATFSINGKNHPTKLSIKGIYNAYNAAAAIALVKQILPKAKDDQLISTLSKVESAFGRGESLSVDGVEIELLLVKNTAGFQLSLKSFASNKHDFMIATNDTFADGRDVSWLQDIDFTGLPHVQVVSGTRATDVAHCLKHNKVPCSLIDENLDTAVSSFLKSSNKPKRIFCSYTAMLHIRKLLSKLSKIKA